MCLLAFPCRAHRELAFEPDGTISGLVSLEGEKISFVEPVNPAATGAHGLGYLQVVCVPLVSCMQHAE